MFDLPSTLQPIVNERTQRAKVHLLLKRDDLIHPEISGNKWRKLKYNLEQARTEGKSRLVTFGGAFSNHITATAAAGKYLGFETVGIIRGEPHHPLNSSLQFAQDCGMQFIYLDRTHYRDKDISSISSHPLLTENDRIYWLPEGGANMLAVKGCEEIVSEIDTPFDFICAACGTGTTLAGMAAALSPKQKAIGFPVLKNGEFLFDDIRRLTNADCQLMTDYHFGGYAKTTPELIQFIHTFYQEQQVLLDYVYTGKMMYGIFDLIQRGWFPEGSVIIAVHTGGVQNANVFNLKSSEL
ncbi:MAG TPA: pyridoxal-phosphate dependent enzyme [Chitinophagales bacterium]|nr:pyridoxal-phosphate dependent enzyme [Chitinophagales bacterium]HQO31772.1 pyridoxal-phosphate dependent enzyme [Chitinophagales bacterium]